MRTRIEKGTTLGSYEVVDTLRADAIFQWIQARDSRDGHPVVLQIPRPDVAWSKEEIAALQRYFDRLTSADRKGLLVPELVVSDKEYPLVLVYREMPGRPFDELVSRALELAIGCSPDACRKCQRRNSPECPIYLWGEASETLHALHNKSLVHGRVSSDSFIVAEEKVYLTNFGYAPLLDAGHGRAVSECREFLAPEVIARHPLTKNSDIYAFAKAVAYLRPALGDTEWYRQATDPDPQKRFKGKVREMFAELQRTFLKMQTEQGTAAKPPDEEPREPSTPSGSTGGVIPVHSLEVKVEPPGSGTVAKDKPNYPESEDGEPGEAEIRATPRQGWKFDRWGGDLEGSGNPARLKMATDKTVVAHFARAPLALRVVGEPAEGGGVSGGGDHPFGLEVQIEAWPRPSWKFDCWTGDVSSSANPVRVRMDSGKTVVAHFSRAPRVLRVTADPSEGGGASGGGEYVAGTVAQVEAWPRPGWKFDRWSGDIIGSANPAKLKMDTDKVAVAHFTRLPQALNVSVDPPGSGEVLGGGDYAHGTEVQVKARPAPSWQFDYWSGDLISSANPAKLKMDTNKSIVAHLVKEPEGKREARVRKRVILMLLGSFWTLLLFLAGYTTLLVAWAVPLGALAGTTVLAGIAFVLAGIGIFLTRLLLGSESLCSIATEELEREASAQRD